MAGQSDPLDLRRERSHGSPSRWAAQIWWIALATGAVGFAVAWFATPAGREIGAAWELLVKLFAFACLAAGIAFFPWATPRLHWLLVVPFIFLTGYVIPRISFYYFVDGDRAEADSFYTHLYLLLYPGAVLAVVAAYRLGGGRPGRCLKIAASGIIILFSGWLDLMWWVVNPIELPDLIDAPHINMFTGGPISFGATILFALAHLPILVGVNLLPLDRWLDRLLGTNQPRLPARPASR